MGATVTGPPDAALELRGLEKRFGTNLAVAGVDLAVPHGAFLVLLGPSGCGKTTILRMLAGLEVPTGGELCLDGTVVADGRRGVVVPAGRRHIGLVFQSYALWPHMTVRGNVAWPLKVARHDRAERRGRVDEVLDLLGIGALAERYPGELSGGQQQRVAIARMIAPRPRVLLFDEPLSNLDATLRAEMRSELLRVHRATGATSVHVTHDQVEATTMATHVPDRVTVSLEPGPGRLPVEFAEAVLLAGRVVVTGRWQGRRLSAVTGTLPPVAVGDRLWFVLPPRPDAVFAGDDDGTPA